MSARKNTQVLSFVKFSNDIIFQNIIQILATNKFWLFLIVLLIIQKFFILLL